MNKKEFIKYYAKKYDLSFRDSKSQIEKLLETMKEIIIKEEKLTINNFGNFKVKKEKERIRMNPKTGEKITSKEYLKVQFKSSKKFF